MKLENPQQLTQLVDSLVMAATNKLDLNRQMANRARQFFRAQIRTQRDIDNNPYQSRTTRKRISLRKDSAKVTQNNRNMLMGLSKSLRTQADEKSFEVGLTGVAGKIGHDHNEGQTISFTTRVNGFYNSKTGKWEGGRATKRNYQMPQRTFLGWTPKLERELMAMAAEHFTSQATEL